MTKRLIYIIITLLLVSLNGNSQDTDFGTGYRTGMLANPAFSGTVGDGQLNLSYFNFYPGNSYNLNSYFLSYDTYIPVLHGGTGFYLSNDALGGVYNDLRGGLGYAYHLKADNDFYINAGLTASVINRGVKRSKIILPDQINPFGGGIITSAETISDLNHAVFDIGVGFLITYKNMTGGIALNHFAEPDLSGTGNNDFRIRRKYSFQLSGTFNDGVSKSVIVRPIISAEVQGNHASLAAGSSFRYNIISVNAVLFGDKERNIDLQTGFSLSAGKAIVYYNYKFNLVSSSEQFPFSLLHQTGVIISLNIVDKRKIIKTINFPEL